MSVIWKIDPNYKNIFTHAQILFSSGIWTTLPEICSLTPTSIIQHLGVCRVLGLCQPWTSQEKIGHDTVPLSEEVKYAYRWMCRLRLWDPSLPFGSLRLTSWGREICLPTLGISLNSSFTFGAIISLSEYRGAGLDSLAWFLYHHHLSLPSVWMKI